MNARPQFHRQRGIAGGVGASFCIFLFIAAASLSAQTLSVFNIDASAFPKMKAKFHAFNAAGEPISVNSIGDVTVQEDGVTRNVTRVSCPPVVTSLGISSVLTIDNSGSMSGKGIEIAKAAARAWINALLLGASECAITTFNERACLNKDFTTDRAELLKVINTLSLMSGTDYDQAFLSPKMGALQVTKHGMPLRKVIVFLTDGLPNTEPNYSAIINEAKRQGVAIYCVILGMPAPREVKDICDQTGGLWFENVITAPQAEDIYKLILQSVQGGSLCDLEWISDGCGSSSKIVISLPAFNASAALTYTVPTNALPHIVYPASNSLHFGQIAPGTLKTMHVTFIARGRPVRVDSIRVSNARFRIKDTGGKTFPFTLDAGQSVKLTVEYEPSDSSYAYCLCTIVSDACMGNSFYADGGWRSRFTTHAKIKVMRPNGGEQLIAGSEEVLTWDGVMPEENVKLEYKTSAAAGWNLITETATGLRYVWRVPKTSSSTCLLQATAEARQAFLGDMAEIPAGTFRMGDITGYGTEPNEHPVHVVTITRSFLMSRTEVTQAQWNSVMGSNQSQFQGDSLPVERVRWYDAVKYCNRLSKQELLDTCYTGSGVNTVCDFTANGYRLPTEAEWEYACRGGTDTDFYTGNLTSLPCSIPDPALDIAAWFCGNRTIQMRNVGLKQANTFGLFDMHGNAWEWCWDWYSSSYYKEAPASDPPGPSSRVFPHESRVIRGGAWMDSPNQCRSASRDDRDPGVKGAYCGFRVVRTY